MTGSDRPGSSAWPWRLSLRVQVAAAILLSVTVSSLLFAGSLLYANGELEHALYNVYTTQELKQVRGQLQQDESAPLPHNTSRTHVYLRSRASERPVPELFAHKGPGTYANLFLNGRFYHLKVQDLKDDRIYVAMDVSEFERKESRLRMIIIGGAVMAPLAGFWAWLGLSRRLTRSLTELAHAVERIDPKRRRVRLAGTFQGYEVEQIAAGFDRYMERLDSFVEREQLFTAAASHELRTPLSVIFTAADLLKVDSGLSSRQAAAVGRIHRAAQDMIELTGTLLFLARDATVKSQDSSVQCDLAATLRRIVDNYRGLAADNNVALEVDIGRGDVLAAPESAVSIVLGNLLRNAIAFSPKAAVQVRLAGCRVDIVDSGPGIAPELLEQVFERNSRSRNSHGAGLGLYLAKNVCDRYGWNVMLRSQPGAGTRASVEFSLAKEAAQAERTDVPRAQSA